jgi:hypothetical protein
MKFQNKKNWMNPLLTFSKEFSNQIHIIIILIAKTWIEELVQLKAEIKKNKEELYMNVDNLKNLLKLIVEKIDLKIKTKMECRTHRYFKTKWLKTYY